MRDLTSTRFGNRQDLECPRAGAWQTWSLQARRPRFGSRVSTKKRAKNRKPFWRPPGPRGKRSPRKRNAARFFGGKFWEPTTTTTIPGSALTRQSRVPSPGTPSTRRRGKREGCAADRPGAPDEEEEKVLKGRLRTIDTPKNPSTGMGRGKLSRIFSRDFFDAADAVARRRASRRDVCVRTGCFAGFELATGVLATAQTLSVQIWDLSSKVWTPKRCGSMAWDPQSLRFQALDPPNVEVPRFGPPKR